MIDLEVTCAGMARTERDAPVRAIVRAMALE